MDKSITLRKVSTQDAGDIALIYNHYVRNTTVTFEQTPVTEEEMRQRLISISSAYPYLVAEMSGVGVVGYCYVHPWKSFSAYSCTVETTVYVRDGMLSSGIGRMLMLALIDECGRREGIHTLIACITAENTGSIRFHERLGFKAVSHFSEVGLKFDRYLDVVDMELVFRQEYRRNMRI